MYNRVSMKTDNLKGKNDMKKELLEKLKSAKSKEEISALIHEFRESPPDSVQELSMEDLDGVAGGLTEEGKLMLDMILNIYNYMGFSVAASFLKDYCGATQKQIDEYLAVYRNNEVAVIVEIVERAYRS